jgi:hypothetical protein
MDTLRSLRRDDGLRQVGSWTRRITAGAVLGCAVLMAGFAHVLPNLASHLSGLRGDSGENSTSQPGQAPHAPGAGTGPGSVRSGAS